MSTAIAVAARVTQRARAARRRVRALQDPTATLSFEFNVTNPYARRWAETTSATLITEITADTAAGIRGVVGQMFRDGIAPVPAARKLRDLKLVGLHSRQQQMVLNLERQLRDPDNFGKTIKRFGPAPGLREKAGFRVRIPRGGLSEAQIQRRLAQYSRMQLNWRARNIARTESIRAANEGQREAWIQARDRGEIAPDMEREWSAATGDSRTCPICENLDGSTAPLEGTFEGGIAGPPAHGSCRCSTSLVRKGEGRKTASEVTL